MSTNITVANKGQSGSSFYCGQSFTPDVPGPDGGGSVGSATTAALESIVVGYPGSATGGRTGLAYVYSALLNDPSDVGTSTDLVATSSTTTDEAAFGAAGYSRTFYMGTSPSLQVGSVYYIYFAEGQSVRYADSSPYSGGAAIDQDGDLTTQSLQFIINLQVG